MSRGTRINGFRSKFEDRFHKEFPSLTYEKDKFEYVIPASKHQYCPDWKITDNLFAETKGRFEPKDRQKLLLIKQQHPEIEIILIFQNPKLVLGKRLGTVADWCDKNGFRWFSMDNKEKLHELIERSMKGIKNGKSN